MSLLKPRLMTPARLAASRRNALICTGPRTAWGKAQSRLICLWSGWSWPSFRKLWFALLDAQPGAGVDETASAVLAPEQALHPRFVDLVETFRQAEIEVCAQSRQLFGQWKKGTQKAPAPPSEPEKLLKTNRVPKSFPSKAARSLKANEVILFSPNIHENKGSYAPSSLLIRT